MIENPHKPKRILSAVEVLRRCQISRAALYQKLDVKSPYHDPDFPVQVKLGLHSVGWIESEIEAWIDHRIALRNAQLLKRGNVHPALNESGKSQVNASFD